MVFRWCLVGAWMLIIFLLSGEPADISSGRSGALVALLQGLGFDGSADVISSVIRKIAHAALYTGFGVGLFMALSIHRQGYKGAALASLLVAFGYAITDEIHQTFVSGRSGELRDVAIDTLGASLGVLVAVWWFQRKIKEDGRDSSLS